MASQHTPTHSDHEVQQGFAAFGAIAAGIVMATVGVLQLLEGISAVKTDTIVVTGQQYTYEWDRTGWGWLHIILGILVILAGLALTTGAVWARVIAIVFASFSIIANFLWLPYNPWWAVLIIALDAFVIWAAATWNPRIA